jgi:hypothetical protein
MQPLRKCALIRRTGKILPYAFEVSENGIIYEYFKLFRLSIYENYQCKKFHRRFS